MSPDQLYRSRHADFYAGRRGSLSATGAREGDGRGRVEEDEEASSILISLANQTPAPVSTTTSTSSATLPLSGLHFSQAPSTSTAPASSYHRKSMSIQSLLGDEQQQQQQQHPQSSLPPSHYEQKHGPVHYRYDEPSLSRGSSKDQHSKGQFAYFYDARTSQDMTKGNEVSPYADSHKHVHTQQHRSLDKEQLPETKQSELTPMQRPSHHPHRHRHSHRKKSSSASRIVRGALHAYISYMTYTSIAAANRQRQRQEHPPTSHYYYPASTHQHPKTAFTRYETQNSPYTKVSEKHVPSADGHREEPMSVDVTASPLSNLTLQTPTATTFPRETESATPAFAHPLTSMTHSSSTPPTDSKSKHNGNGAMPLTNIIHRPLTAFLDGSRGESSSSAPGAGSSSHYRWTHPR